ncbi:MAG TPA: GNAT family N-acetyltransferase [Gemmatimonadales bacterium]|nr:GNAT family N-acetyltransferase [Gemmatimonadales bacterium]
MKSGQVRIVEVGNGDELEEVRTIFQEYAESLGSDPCLQDFAEELATLPGRYARPGGRLLLAMVGDKVAGCAALRSLDAETGEMKRVYVRPGFRGLGLGRRLAESILQESRAAGYRRVRLDTLPSMVGAQRLYQVLGFREIAPYGDNRVAGAVYLELELDRAFRET